MAAIEIKQRGQVTLPKRLRDRYGLTEGKRMTLIDLGGGVFVLSPKESKVDERADRIRDRLLASGATLEDMLAELRQLREADGREA